MGILVAKPQTGVAWWGTFNPALVGPPTWFSAPPSEWDIVRVGPNLQPLPGLAKVVRCERRMRLHRKDHPASDFEDQTFQGWSVVEFDFTLTMWHAAQLAALQNWLGFIFAGAGDPPDKQTPDSVSVVTSITNLVNPNNAKARATQAGQQLQIAKGFPKRQPPPGPVRASHPNLQMHGVSSIIFEKMGGPYMKSEKEQDVFIAHFKTVQFKPSTSVKHETFRHDVGQPGSGWGGLTAGMGSPYAVPPGSSPSDGPSSSGGADPNNFANFESLAGPGGQAGGATGGW